MKNKLMLAILPLLALTSCGSNPQAFVPYVSHAGIIPTIHMSPTEHSVYLMLTKYGYIELSPGVKTYGEDQPAPLYYQNCVKLNLDAGETLPVAKTDVAGATFRGWAFYNEDNENVWPDYYDKVPATSGMALKAIFDGTSAGGGGSGGGGGSQASDITWTVTDMPTWVTDDNCVIFAWAWQNGVTGAWYELAYTNATTATFEAPSDLAGMLLARCAAGTTLPNWDETGTGPGRVFNQTNDVNTEVGKTSYSFPEQIWKSYTPGA